MRNIKNILTNIKKEDFFTRANLHIHSVFSDGLMLPEQIISSAIKNRLEVVSITDHNTIDAYSEIDIGELKDISLIPGVEFDCWHKSDFMHILGYGFDLDNEALKQLCATSKKETELDIIRIFSGRKAKDVIQTIKKAGGVSVLAHPACCWNLRLKSLVRELVGFGLDGIEVYYPYVRHRAVVKFHTVKKVEKIADEFNLIKTGGTDCHSLNILDNTNRK